MENLTKADLAFIRFDYRFYAFYKIQTKTLSEILTEDLVYPVIERGAYLWLVRKTMKKGQRLFR